MSVDGWSKVHNEPIVCASITDLDGKTIISETTDTTGNRHDSEYLQKNMQWRILSAQTKYAVKVGSFVTDNAANMVEMRKRI